MCVCLYVCVCTVMTLIFMLNKNSLKIDRESQKDISDSMMSVILYKYVAIFTYRNYIFQW